MSLETAKQNLKEFGKELGLGELEFDENNTCILGIDDDFSLHITYEENGDRLYLYSPLLDGLPRDDKTKLRLYERLLEGSMLGGKMAGGGVGVAVQEELILIHCTLDMNGAEEIRLRKFAPLYVQTVEEWRKICREISTGIDDGGAKRDLGPSTGGGTSSGSGKPPAGGMHPGAGPGFLKI